MTTVSVRVLDDVRDQYQAFHDRFVLFTSGLQERLKAGSADDLKKVVDLPKVLKPTVEKLEVNRVANMLNVAQAVMDAAFGLVDTDNIYDLVWVDSKRQTMKSFIEICWESCASANCTVKSLEEGKGAGGIKVDDFASSDASKDDKDKVAKFLTVLANEFTQNNNKKKK